MSATTAIEAGRRPALSAPWRKRVTT
jgi:hypothetical protein